jgi:hypothetical protein
MMSPHNFRENADNPELLLRLQFGTVKPLPKVFIIYGNPDLRLHYFAVTAVVNFHSVSLGHILSWLTLPVPGIVIVNHTFLIGHIGFFLQF